MKWLYIRRLLYYHKSSRCLCPEQPHDYLKYSCNERCMRPAIADLAIEKVSSLAVVLKIWIRHFLIYRP